VQKTVAGTLPGARLITICDTAHQDPSHDIEYAADLRKHQNAAPKIDGAQLGPKNVTRRYGSGGLGSALGAQFAKQQR
jgi:hypothetical protein